MIRMAKIMDEYFDTVTNEQFLMDLIEAGIMDCPDKVEVLVKNEP